MITKHFKTILLSFALLAAANTTNIAAMSVTESKDALQADDQSIKDELAITLITAIKELASIAVFKEGTTEYRRQRKQQLHQDIRLLLANGANVNYFAATDNTALRIATRYGLTTCVDMLIRAKANLNEEDHFHGQTPLHEAAKDFYCGMHGTNYKQDPAVDAAHLDCVKKLVAAGATIDIADLWGHTAYHEAIRANRPAIVEYLLEMGANKSLVDNLGQPLVEIPSEEIKAAIQNGIKKHQARINAHHNLMRIAPLLAFCRANAKHPFKNSILPLVDHDIMPFITANPSQTKNNDTSADTSSALTTNPT